MANERCASCGSGLPEGAAYCIVCGNPGDGGDVLRQEQRPRHIASDEKAPDSPAPPTAAQQSSPVPQQPRSDDGGSSQETSARETGKQPTTTRRRKVLAALFAPFVWLERRILEPFAHWLKDAAFLEILEYAGKFAILVVVVFWIFGTPDRLRTESFEAWQVITNAQGEETAGGRLEALRSLYETDPLERLVGIPQSLEKLVANNASLAGIDLYDDNDEYDRRVAWFLFNVREGGADLDRSNFQDANLAGADLRKASLERAVLRRADLRPNPPGSKNTSDLSGANLSNADLREAKLDKANLTGANLSDANLAGATLRGAKLPGSCLWYATFEGANLREANLQHANPRTVREESKCTGQYVNFRNADLVGANFQGANLKGVDFTGANVGGADFTKTKGLTQDQIESVIGNNKTKLPGYLHPALRDWEAAIPLLEDGEGLSAERHYTGLFGPTLSFRTGEGWWVSGGETEDGLEISSPLGFNIAFLSVDEVFDTEDPTKPQNPMEDNLTTFHERLVDWLKSHPHLDVTEESNVTIGGITGTQLDISAHHTPENYPPDCDGPCTPVFANEAAPYLYPDKDYRFIILHIGGETISIVLSWGSQEHEKTAEADKLLDSVAWTDYELPSGEEVASGLFEPGLSFTASEGWLPTSQVTDFWELSHPDARSYLSLHNVSEVYDGHPTEKDVPPTPEELVAWLKENEHLDVEDVPEKMKVPVGGVEAPGVQLFVRVDSIPEDVHPDCKDTCIPVWYGEDDRYSPLYDGYLNQLVILQVRGETVVINIESPEEEFDGFRDEAKEVLSTVKWRGCSTCEVSHGPERTSSAKPPAHSSHTS